MEVNELKSNMFVKISKDLSTTQQRFGINSTMIDMRNKCYRIHNISYISKIVQIHHPNKHDTYSFDPGDLLKPDTIVKSVDPQLFEPTNLFKE